MIQLLFALMYYYLYKYIYIYKLFRILHIIYISNQLFVFIALVIYNLAKD